LRVTITIETETESLVLASSKEEPEIRNADGRTVVYGFKVETLWERVRDDAQAWVDARSSRNTCGP
jgi:hypothetical protein